MSSVPVPLGPPAPAGAARRPQAAPGGGHDGCRSAEQSAAAPNRTRTQPRSNAARTRTRGTPSARRPPSGADTQPARTATNKQESSQQTGRRRSLRRRRGGRAPGVKKESPAGEGAANLRGWAGSKTAAPQGWERRTANKISENYAQKGGICEPRRRAHSLRAGGRRRSRRDGHIMAICLHMVFLRIVRRNPTDYPPLSSLRVLPLCCPGGHDKLAVPPAAIVDQLLGDHERVGHGAAIVDQLLGDLRRIDPYCDGHEKGGRKRAFFVEIWPILAEIGRFDHGPERLSIPDYCEDQQDFPKIGTVTRNRPPPIPCEIIRRFWIPKESIHGYFAIN